jgi:hypothetical protein
MPLGGSWADDGSVVFATFTPPNLWRVPESGGEPVAIARGQQETDTAYSWPHVLPGARTAVAMVWRPTDDQWQIATVSLKTGETRALGPGSFPRYAATGHLVYWRDLSIWALPFDATRVESSGAPVPVVVGVEADEVGSAAFAIAERGSLVYAPGTRQTELTWVDRRGARERLPVDVSSYFDPSLSPDGRRLALVKPQESNQDVWIYDIPADTWFRLTTQPGWDGAPIWDPGGHITFGERSQKEFSLLRATIGTAGSVEKLVGGSAVKFPSSWSPDGRNLAYIESTGTAWDIWMLDETREARPFLQAAFNETDPVFSPDGQYLAYTSDESGDREVYVVAFPEGGGKQPISQHGGFWPVWARNGQRLFYRTESHVMSVEVRGDGEFGVPEPLFEAPVLGGVMRGYDVAPDGERLIVIQKLAGRSEIGFELVLNWFEELKRLAPAN